MGQGTIRIRVRVVEREREQVAPGMAAPAAVVVCAVCRRREVFLDTQAEHTRLQREWCRTADGWQHIECPEEPPDLACPPVPRELVPDWTLHCVGPETYQRHEWGRYTDREQRCGVVMGVYPYIMGG